MAAGKAVKPDEWETVAPDGDWQTVDPSSATYTGTAQGSVADAARQHLGAMRSGQDIPASSVANPATAPPEEQPNEWFNSDTRMGAAKKGADAVATSFLGAGRGALRTVYYLDKLTGGHISKELGLNPQDVENALKTHNVFDAIGQGAETAAELAGGEAALTLPTRAPAVASMIARVTEAAPRLMKAAGYLGTAATRAVAGAAVTRAEGASGEDAATSGALNAAIPIGFDALGAAGKLVGARMLNSKIRLTGADRANGAEIKTLFDEGLNGLGLRDTFDRVGEKIAGLVQKAKDLRGQAPSALVVDANQMIDQAETKLLKDRRFLGKFDQIKDAMNAYRRDLATLSPTGAFPVEDANELKTAVGYNGNWAYGKIPRDASAHEIASSALHSELKSEIESLTPDDAALKEVNARIGKLLPIQRAILRRIPVDERMNPVGLFKGLALATHNPMMLALDVLQRNIPTASAIYRGGQAAIAGASAAGKAVVGYRQRKIQDQQAGEDQN